MRFRPSLRRQKWQERSHRSLWQIWEKRVESLRATWGSLRSVWRDLWYSMCQNTSNDFRIPGDWKLNWCTLLLRVGQRGGGVEYNPWDCICFENSNDGQGQVHERSQGHVGRKGCFSAAYLIMIMIAKKLWEPGRRRLKGGLTVLGFPPTSLSIPLLWLPREGFHPQLQISKWPQAFEKVTLLLQFAVLPMKEFTCHCDCAHGTEGSPPQSLSVLFKSWCSWMEFHVLLEILPHAQG